MLGLIRPLRFILFSVPLFLLWEYGIRQPYLTVIAQLFAATARLFGQDVHLFEVQAGHMTFWYGLEKWTNEFGMTGINLVPFAALSLATGRTRWLRRFRMLGIGIGVLMLTHILGLWCDIFHFNARNDASTLRVAAGLRALFTGFGTFLFPLLVWLVMVRDLLPLPGWGSAPHSSAPPTPG